MADITRQSADGAGDREPRLASSFRARHRSHVGQFRQDGGKTLASRDARLAGARSDGSWLEPQVPAPADYDLQGVQDGVAIRERCGSGEGPGEQLPVALSHAA